MMGWFGLGDFRYKREQRRIQHDMDALGAVEGDAWQCCEKCRFYVLAAELGSTYHGGCRRHQIKVFRGRVCRHFVTVVKTRDPNNHQLAQRQ